MQYLVASYTDVIKSHGFRIDGEYWHPEAMGIVKKINSNKTLGDLIDYGYRVVYESTYIFRTSEAERRKFPKFVQAADIEFPMINIDTAGYVHESEWIRYPKGRIKKGEVLVEVKGNVSKVTIVPDNFTEKALISGTLYKFTVKENIDKYFLVIYLSCKFGKKLKSRLVSNIATPFINKKELYGIPIPSISESLKAEIKSIYMLAVKCKEASHEIYEQAKELVVSELGLANWKPKHCLTFVKNYSDVQKAERIDADYFQPKYDEIVNTIKQYSGGWDTLDNLVNINDKIYVPKNDSLYKYVELANIGNNGEINDSMVAEGKNLPSRARKKMEANDVIVSSIEGSLSSVALVEKKYHKNLCSTGFHVINSTFFNSETLLVLLKSVIGQMQLRKGASGTILTAINRDEFSKLVLPKLDNKRQNQIQQKITESFNLRKKSKHLLECAKRAVEIAIEKDEKKALSWLESQTKEI